jgi:hypothetical protein
VAENEMADLARLDRGRRLHRAVSAAMALLLSGLFAGDAGAQSTLAAVQSIGSVPATTPVAPPDPDGCATPDPMREATFLASRVAAPRKEAWQDSFGGAELAKPQVKARLAGWPTRLLADRASLPAGDEAFLRRLARDTWLGIDAFTDREHGLPIDHVRFCGGSLDPQRVKIGDYTSGTNIGMHLLSIVGAHDLGLIAREEAVAQIRSSLASLRKLETFQGFFFNYYDTTSLERTSHFVSFVDSAWLTAGLVVARQAFQEVWGECSAIIDQQDYAFFYDAGSQLMHHGVTVTDGRAEPAHYHYGTLYTEARLGALLAIGRGNAPEAMWFSMRRTLPESHAWQRQVPRDRREKIVRGHRFEGGLYEWQGIAHVPSWGGSMFEALMPMLVLDERTFAPKSLGRNHAAHVAVQRRYAIEQLGWPVWGMSPSTQPFAVDYGEFGVPALGVAGYQPTVVTPHAAALAVMIEPAESAANLRRMAERYDLYGEFGLYDSVDPSTGAVAHAYLSLDQTMSFVALVNHLRDGAIQKRFAADPVVTPVLSMLGDEDFFE